MQKTREYKAYCVFLDASKAFDKVLMVWLQNLLNKKPS